MVKPALPPDIEVQRRMAERELEVPEECRIRVPHRNQPGVIVEEHDISATG